jgi:hypothetical protein
MTAYTALVADVVKTEFPDYELFCAFNIFNLTDNSKAGNGNDIALRRLAQAFDVNHAALKDQYHRLRSVALQKKRDGVVGNKDAWKEAVQSCRRAIAQCGLEHGRLVACTLAFCRLDCGNIWC